ncbi:hypothetical protein ACLB9Y_16890 [Chryseobacterium scophthalmum]|uniref:hypothetical protein n=1 Tax=Chryseobacterium scophthalmum TaxID=59733 RepID=UPI00398B775B
MKQFNDEWSDNLSEFKMLSFGEVSNGFEGNKNPLQGIKNPESAEYKDDEYINLKNLSDSRGSSFNRYKNHFRKLF